MAAGAKRHRARKGEILMKINVDYNNRKEIVKGNRWTKGGHDRLYIQDGRTKMGYLDLNTQEWVYDKNYRCSNPNWDRAVIQSVKVFAKTLT
jgi:hypothetical protein